ncbi:MAG: hypothetical protein EXR54_02320 [Dehalococcoidia bacterium]|nr:hypothetical protein [Dehalococcoidia bacterium]
MARYLDALPRDFGLALVDSPSALMPTWLREPLLVSLEHCRQLCNQGRTVVVVMDSGPALDWAVARLFRPPEVHMRLRLAAVQMGHAVRTLEIRRSDEHPEWPAQPVAFRVEERVGIRVVHWRRFRLPTGAWQEAADLT